MCKSKSGVIFRAVLWICSWRRESRRGRTAAVRPSSRSLCQRRAGPEGCHGGNSLLVRKEHERFTRFKVAVVLNLHSMAFQEAFLFFLPSCLCRQDVRDSLLGMELVHLQETQRQWVIKIGAHRRPWLPFWSICLFFFFQRTAKESHKAVRWRWQNMTTTVRGQGLPVTPRRTYT